VALQFLLSSQIVSCVKTLFLLLCVDLGSLVSESGTVFIFMIKGLSLFVLIVLLGKFFDHIYKVFGEICVRS
jgi:hypothetical protein